MTNALEDPPLETGVDTETLDRDGVTVISGDDVRDARRCIEQLTNETLLRKGGQFISIAAGGGGFNYLHVLEPDKITFFDANEHALNWLKLLLHLIRVSPDRLTFVTSLFARPADDVPANLADAEAFLRQPGSVTQWQSVHDAIDDDDLAEVHDHFGRLLMEAPAGTMILPFGRCSGLSVPELPSSNFIGLMQDPEMAYPENYRCLNLNEGWLADEKTYAKTREILETVDVKFRHSSLRDLPISELTEDVEWTYVYVSNENGISPDEWVATLIQWKVACIAAFPLSRVIVMTAFDGAADVINDQLSKLDLNRSSRMNRLMAGRGAHFRAWHAVKLHLRGQRVCELVRDQSIGFSEIERDVLLFKDFAKKSPEYDTVIMHRPLTTGIDGDLLLKCIAECSKMKARVILFDHNPECDEFASGQAMTPDLSPIEEWWTLQTALARVKETVPKTTTIETFHTGNFKESDRNWFVILDSEPIERDRILVKWGLDDMVNDLRTDHMKQYKVMVLSHFAAKAFKEKDYDAVVLAAMEAHFLAPGDLSVAELYCWAMCYIGQPDLAASAITLVARIHGEITEEMKRLAAKFGFSLRSAEPFEG